MAATTIADKPTSGSLYWTAYADLEGDTGPTDPLRFDMYAQRLGNLIAPGITNRTARARYMSMVCAGLATTYHPGASVRQRRKAFLPFERGWALAMTIAADGQLKRAGDGDEGRGLRPEYAGLRGANRVLRRYREIEGREVVKPTDYILLQGQDAQGGLGAYLVTLREFGFVHSDSLTLTVQGQALAAAFRPHGSRSIKLAMFAEESGVRRSHLRRLGEHSVLGHPTAAECALVRDAVFDSPRSTVGDAVRRVKAAYPDLIVSGEQAMHAVARSGDDPLARAAGYALRFDPLRIAAQTLFSALGTALKPQTGSVTVAKLGDHRIEEASARVGQTAAAVLDELPPHGLEAIRLLAQECAAADDVAKMVDAVVAHHRREQRGWIIPESGGRYRLGQHGLFDQPNDSFNGYTLGRALALHRDLAAMS